MKYEVKSCREVTMLAGGRYKRDGRAGLMKELGRSLKTTNTIESMMSLIGQATGKEDYWKNSDRKKGGSSLMRNGAATKSQLRMGLTQDFTPPPKQP